MKEYGNDFINLDVDNNKTSHMREKPSFKQNTKRKKNYYKNILDDNDSSNLIELSSKNGLNQNNLDDNFRKSHTTYKKNNNLDEKSAENLINENKKKLTRLTNKTYYDKSKINLTPEQNRYKVNIIKRNLNNNIYINNIDQSIYFVIPYKYKCSIYMFIFLGIPYIITKFSNRKLIEWRSEPCKVPEADFYLIIDGYGNYHICNFTKKCFNPNFNAENRIKGYDNKYISTLFSSIDIYNKIEYHEIFYVYNKYFCYKKKGQDDIKKNLNEIFEEEKDNNIISISNDNVNKSNRLNKDYYFESQIFDMSFTTNENIYKIFNNNFMKQKEIQFQLDVYGPNKLILKNINFLTILFEKILNLVTIYILFIIIFYWYENYHFFICILVVSIVLLMITTYQKYLNQKKVVDFSLNKQDKITVYEGGDHPPRLIDYENLVPGQIIKVKEEDILPCDCLLLEGFCSVIESSLTGESSSIMKYKLPKNSSNFIYTENMKSYLFCGTKIENCFPKELKVLVIGTGFNTQRGNLIQSVLVPRKSNYNFYKENITFFIFTLSFFIIGLIVFIIFHYRNENNTGGGNLFENILDLLAMALPSALPLTLTLGTFYYQYSLINKQISCSGVYRLMAAGKINKIIFDKTGTLTEEDLELHGYISSVKKDNYLMLDSREKNSKLYLSNLSEYYKNEFHNRILAKNKEKNDKENIIEINSDNNEENQSDNEIEKKKKDDTDNTITYFMECLATCHSVTKINDENKGNSIDIKIFNEVNWIYDPLNLTSNANDQFEVKPKKYFKITEEQFFMKNKKINLNLDEDELNSYKLKVIFRSHFESRNQSMSVIVKNNFNNSIRLYIKGAPEKIIRQCLDNSIPSNYDIIQRKYTLQGYRVLACATKLISNSAEKEKEIISNEEYQNYRKNDLVFLGLILFQNKIKTHTKKVLQKLKNDGLFPIISTGDSAFTSISLVKECNLVKNNSKFCIMEIDPTYLDTDSKSSKLSKNNNNNNFLIQCTIEEVNYEKPSKNSSETFTVVLNDKIETGDYEAYNRSSFRTKSKNLLNIEEFNNKILTENDMKLCIQSRVFDHIFFRNKETSSENNRESILETNPNKTKEKIKEEEELNLLRQIIVDRGILFFRMNPNDKTKLIQLFKKQNPNNIVAMCGDGANDCSALISADVGVSLKSRENIIMTSHLMAKTKSIAIINDIISIGKTCYENSTIILKILLVYSEIKICSRCLLKIHNDNLTKYQYFYLDFVIILLGGSLMSFSDPNYKIKEKTFSRLLISQIYLISIIGHSIIQLTLLLVYFFCILEKEDYYLNESNNNNTQRDLYSEHVTYLNSYLFYFNSNQCLSMVFFFNFFSKCKQSIFKSRIFMVYVIFVFIILSEVLSLGSFNVGMFKIGLVQFVELNSEGTNSQYSRLILFAFCVGNFVLTILWELLLNWIMELYYRKCFLNGEDDTIKKIKSRSK